MKKKEFENILRLQIVPHLYEEERVSGIIDYCVKYGFQHVMLFINAEDYFVGHMTIEEAKPWVAAIQRTKKRLIENGIKVSLNPWIEFGHLDKGRKLKEGQNFTTMVDYDGTACELVACPLCENWRTYYKEFYQYLIREIEPETIWVEDDFRLHNHGDLKYGGCFCELHMQRYNEKLGTNYTREEFTDLLFRKTCDEKVRNAWLDVSRETMTDLAEFLGKTVKEVGLNTKVGLMSSAQIRHSMEARDWYAVHKGLAQGGEMINRLHLPCYMEICAKEYYTYFNMFPYVCRSYIPKETVVLPELENSAFSTFSKNASFLRFQVESAIPLCIDGMTYDIYDFCGNGINEGFGYGEALAKIMPYLNGVINQGIEYDKAEGIIVPADPNEVYNRKADVGNFMSYSPDEYYFGAYIAALGLNTKVSTEKSFKGQIVSLCNSAVYNFTKEQLEDLFANNYVILDGSAAIRLFRMGLGHLFRAKSYKEHWEGKDVHAYEQAADGEEVNGKKGIRAAVRRAGHYVEIEYEDDVIAKSYVYDYYGNVMGYGDADGGSFFVIPYIHDEILYEQYNDLRTSMLRDFVCKKAKTPIVSTGENGVFAYLYARNAEKALMIVNTTVENFETIQFNVYGMQVNEVSVVDKQTGEVRKASFALNGNTLTVFEPFEYLSTQTLLLR